MFVMSFSSMGHYPMGLWVFTGHYCSAFLPTMGAVHTAHNHCLQRLEGIQLSVQSPSGSLLCAHKKGLRYHVTSPLAGLFHMQTKNAICSVLKYQLAGCVWSLGAGTTGSH